MLPAQWLPVAVFFLAHLFGSFHSSRASFAWFNNECRANQLPRKCAAAREANPPLLLFEWAVVFKRTLGKGFAWIHTVHWIEVSSSIVPKQVGFINKYLPATNPPAIKCQAYSSTRQHKAEALQMWWCNLKEIKGPLSLGQFIPPPPFFIRKCQGSPSLTSYLK